jgi:hypothetical protein
MRAPTSWRPSVWRPCLYAPGQHPAQLLGPVRDVLFPIFAFGGFLAGMLLWVQFTRWIGLLYVTWQKNSGDFLGPPKRRLIWAIPFLAVLHPAPWLVGAAAIFAFRSIRADVGGSPTWFFGGLSFALLFMIVSTAMTVARWRRLRNLQSKNSVSR